MSVGVLVERVGEVLGRAHALFGDPPASGGAAALDAGSGLTGAGALVGSGRHQMSGLSGELAGRYAGFAAGAGPALDAGAAADERLGGGLSAAAGADRAGRAASGSVVAGAAADTAGLAPVSGTAAGQRALLAALRARVAQQQRVVDAYRARDARLAAAVRSLVYARRGGAGGMAAGVLPFGSGVGGGLPPAPVSGLAGLPGLIGAGGRGRLTGLVSGVDRGTGRGDGPGEPGQGAARAALSKRGRPYVWGAKGPNTFDCSGLTQWAWRQAGVQLGADTYTQIGQGVAVPPGRVRAGDLIFPLDAFGEGGRSGPGHVQLAISDRQVVHAPAAGDVVRIAPMPDRYIARRPVRALG